VILVDSSVWIDFFNGVENKQTAALRLCNRRSVSLVGDLIMLEVLQGFRHDRDAKRARDAFLALGPVPLCNNEVALRAAENFRSLRRLGVTVRKITDTIIATYCIEHSLPLLHNDRDFVPFQDYLGLRIADV